MTARFETRKMKGVKIVNPFDKMGHFRPQGYGVFDTQRNEFVVLTKNSLFDCFEKKSAAEYNVYIFNTFGATCGNDNLEIIKRFI